MPIAAPHTIAATAIAIRASLAKGDEPWALRLVWEFLDDFYAATLASRCRLIADEPERTGDVRFDAFLAALAEHLAYHHQIAAPPWSADPGQVLEPWWFVAPFRSLHATALMESPASFRRRGIFISANALSRC